MLCLLPAFSYNTILPSFGPTLYLRAYPVENRDTLLLCEKNKGTLSPALAACAVHFLAVSSHPERPYKC